MNIAELLKSKKFKALVLGVVVALGAQLGLDEAASAGVLDKIMLMVCAYLGAQGVADFGKSRAAAAEHAADTAREAAEYTADAAKVAAEPEKPAA